MTERSKRAVHGWLVLDKPLGLTSTQCVGKARWAMRADKVGHAGTLDPLASGVLAIAFGEATKTVPYAMDGSKLYRFTVQWGTATTTDDAEGEVIATSDHRPDAAAIRAALAGLTGLIQQRPPAFSALRLNGERAYDLARAGEVVALPARPIRIDSLVLEECTADSATLTMRCGKGGYVRALARDLAISLGTVGHVTALRRLEAGPFTLEHAISFEKLEELRHSPDALKAILPVSTGLDDIPALAVTAKEAARLRKGMAVTVAEPCVAEGTEVWASLGDVPVAVGLLRDGALHPKRVFNL